MRQNSSSDTSKIGNIIEEAFLLKLKTKKSLTQSMNLKFSIVTDLSFTRSHNGFAEREKRYE
jgi:hypothetical protein